MHMAPFFLIKANSYLFSQEINFGGNALGSSRSEYANLLLHVGQLRIACLYFIIPLLPLPPF